MLKGKSINKSFDKSKSCKQFRKLSRFLRASGYLLPTNKIILLKEIIFDILSFDKLTKSRRSQYGANMIKTKDTFREISRKSELKELNWYGFASDQSPKKSKAVYWNYFLNNWVPIHILSLIHI